MGGVSSGPPPRSVGGATGDGEAPSLERRVRCLPTSYSQRHRRERGSSLAVALRSGEQRLSERDALRPPPAPLKVINRQTAHAARQEGAPPPAVAPKTERGGGPDEIPPTPD